MPVCRLGRGVGCRVLLLSAGGLGVGRRVLLAVLISGAVSWVPKRRLGRNAGC